ncbi:DUF5797 family protein [Halogeometricum rufum]|uniref:DUF5797 family protein n=1 Tax=Halogeometricum rufum TaxID=553469 RepID=UPI001FE33727|nr:DUF5797 family protein [Halogeometricum rufum]
MVERILDIVAVQPTSNSELSDRWGMSYGKEVHRYLTSNLEEYYYRGPDVKIRATEAAEKIRREWDVVRSSHIEFLTCLRGNRARTGSSGLQRVN